MTAKVKSALTVLSEALETAAGYALVAVGIYAAIFIDMTGSGSLWKTMRHVQATAHEGVESPNGTQIVKVPTQPVVEKVHEDRILAVFDEAPADGVVSAVYQAPGSRSQRPSAAFTDTPADPNSGKTWKRGIKGELRNFTVYGNGDAKTSATSAVGATASRAAVAVTPPVATVEGSPARAETAAAVRPGMSSRLSHGALAASDSSRNVR